MLLPLLLLMAIQTPDASVPAIFGDPGRPSPDGPLPEKHAHEAVHLVSITGAPLELLKLARLDLDTLALKLDEGEVKVLARDHEIEAVRDLGLTATVEIEDLSAFYARRLTADESGAGAARSRAAGGPYGQWLSPEFGQGSMGGYYTYAEIVSVLDQMAAAYPALVAPKVSIGTSLEGRPLWMVKLSDNPTVDESEPEMRLDALHHSREPQGMQATLYFLSYLLEGYGTDPVATYLLNEREIYVVPCVNPDGYEYNRSQAPGGGGLWRKNRRDNGGSFGVDLNRNYSFQWGGAGSSGTASSETYRGPSPGSEPETQAMMQFISSRSFATALSVHTYSNVWLSSWGYVAQYPPDWPEMQEIGDLASADNGYTHGPVSIVLYLADGGTVDYDYGVNGTYSWTPEIGSSADGFWPARNRILPLAEENLTGFASTALAAGTWLRPLGLVAIDEGDMDGTFEPGEDVVIDAFVRNSGRADSGPAQVTMVVNSPFATVTDGNSIVSAASFSTGQNTAPLRLVIDPAAPMGAVLPIVVTVTEGGRSFELSAEIALGVRTLAAFDFESGGAQGWAVGAPNDATTGEWIMDDPNGTAAQPENDHTPDPGSRCWFTGQATVGASSGVNDVDGGSTTLVSPTFDLSGTQSASLRYARWYSNSTGSAPGADVFQVDLSDDGGASWVAADVVGPAGAGTSGGWIEAEVDIAQYVSLTSNVRARFIASDLGAGSIVEAAIDDVEIVVVDMPTCPQPVNYCPLTPNQWATGATIAATGSTDVTQNALTLTVSNANPSGFGLFFYGQGRAMNPVGNGNICIAGAFARLPAVMTDGTGFGSYTLDFTSLPVPILNGETWNFQYWLRDVGGAGFNFSNGLEIEFCQP
ncbi:Carboxypeptidase T precursor [Planctomycetes bacterium Poly30]|uniref:carboxypeptidase T n=1 Tax=Saltatorellus ferox TaxID=2528018 RepID=A0A518EMG4_9BACT|nr:Carboxypeptidase T precursor [Planctomycetes bacterium Poly30]